MSKFPTITSRVAVLLADDIDTDQIIPARFLKVTDKVGLGANLFSDWRYNADGSPKPEFVLNQPEFRDANILLAGNNFGCGSSREHAPWALKDQGIRAVISTAFADIFKNNALKNGVLPVMVTKGVHREICDMLSSHPTAEISVDLASQSVRLPGGATREFPIDNFAKTCLLEGTDELGYIMRFEKQITAFESHH